MNILTSTNNIESSIEFALYLRSSHHDGAVCERNVCVCWAEEAEQKQRECLVCSIKLVVHKKRNVGTNIIPYRSSKTIPFIVLKTTKCLRKSG